MVLSGGYQETNAQVIAKSIANIFFNKHVVHMSYFILTTKNILAKFGPAQRTKQDNQ